MGRWPNHDPPIIQPPTNPYLPPRRRCIMRLPMPQRDPDREAAPAALPDTPLSWSTKASCVPGACNLVRLKDNMMPTVCSTNRYKAFQSCHKKQGIRSCDKLRYKGADPLQHKSIRPRSFIQPIRNDHVPPTTQATQRDPLQPIDRNVCLPHALGDNAYTKRNRTFQYNPKRTPTKKTKQSSSILGPHPLSSSISHNLFLPRNPGTNLRSSPSFFPIIQKDPPSMETFSEEDELLIQKFIGLQASENKGPIVQLPENATSSQN